MPQPPLADFLDELVTANLLADLVAHFDRDRVSASDYSEPGRRILQKVTGVLRGPKHSLKTGEQRLVRTAHPGEISITSLRIEDLLGLLGEKKLHFTRHRHTCTRLT